MTRVKYIPQNEAVVFRPKELEMTVGDDEIHLEGWAAERMTLGVNGSMTQLTLRRVLGQSATQTLSHPEQYANNIGQRIMTTGYRR